MRSLGLAHMYDQLIPQPSDSVITFLIAGSSGQASDWLSSGATAVANAAAAGVRFVRFTGVSTVGSSLNFSVNLQTTQAAAPSSGTLMGQSSGLSHPVNGSGMFRVLSSSTGFSVAALSSGYIMCEQWRDG